jgi:hypothetical protein
VLALFLAEPALGHASRMGQGNFKAICRGKVHFPRSRCELRQ